MELVTKKKNTALRVSIIVAILLVIGGAVWYTRPHSAPFCFTFLHDMQFGDRVVKNPINQGVIGAGGIAYFIPEVPALQTALEKEGFYIDSYETTGGHVYSGPFFGPTTKAAVMSFQKKYNINVTGEVGNGTLDKLASIYNCATNTIASSSVPKI